ASSEPTFERAYRRYGETPGFVWLNHCCMSGPVDDSTKYGSPIVTISSMRIRRLGSPSRLAFQRSEGVIGSSASESPSRTRWRITCWRGLRRVDEKCAYA